MYQFYSSLANLSIVVVIILVIIVIFYFVGKQYEDPLSDKSGMISSIILFIVLAVCFNFLSRTELKKEEAMKSAKHFKISTGEVFRLDSTNLEKRIYISGSRSFSIDDSRVID